MMFVATAKYVATKTIPHDLKMAMIEEIRTHLERYGFTEIEVFYTEEDNKGE